MNLIEIPWYAVIALVGSAATGTVAIIGALRNTNTPAANTNSPEA